MACVILLATGGTGGHVYPALFTANELRRRGCQVVFTGTLKASADTVRAAGFSCVAVETGGFVAKTVKEKVWASVLMARAVKNSLRLIRSLRPSAVVGFGGYASFAAVTAAVMVRCPVLIHEQNAVPGTANLRLAPFVQRIATGFRQGLTCFPSARSVWTGTPLRPLKVCNRESALACFGLDPGRKTILVFGGSQGSRVINEFFLDFFSSLPAGRKLQAIHICGAAEYGRYEALSARLCREDRPVYMRAFIDNIDEAYAACDLAVTRAGAGTVTELGRLGVPAVLVPYPGAKGHQLHNARVLERCGNASIIEEKSLSSTGLGAKILEELERNTSRRVLQEQVKNEFLSDPEKRLSDEILSVVRN